MPTDNEGRVAVYIDFDNIVISRYNQLHGRGAFQSDRVRNVDPTKPGLDVSLAERLAEATVDIGTVLDYASSFGQIVVSRAYADWSQPVNAGYRRQLVDRAIDLTQMFPLSATKNGADIRLAIDVVEDLFRLADVTHVVLVAGDSDYVALAQRVKRLGREIIAVGVAGATSRALPAACNDFSLYDDLPGFSSDGDDHDDALDAIDAEVAAAAAADGATVQHADGDAAQDGGSAGGSGSGAASGGSAAEEQKAGKTTKRGKSAAADVGSANDADGDAAADASAESKRSSASASKSSGRRGAARSAGEAAAERAASDAADAGDGDHGGQATKMSARAATTLLRRALTLGHDKNGDEWLHTSAVKQQIKRLDPSFHEKSIGYSSFTDFVKSRSRIAELDKASGGQRVRLRSRRDEG